jgi:arsenite methyltransferase
MNAANQNEIRHTVRTNYAAVAEAGQAGCGAPDSTCCRGDGPTAAAEIALALGYAPDDLAAAPATSNLGLGCGNPQLVAAMQPGETVLDLGSGAGFDCFLAARAVGPDGRVIGVDMTAEMVHKARLNGTASGVENVEFRLGDIEHLPVADESVDLIISNCVVNLSPEKERVLAAAFRVLKPGGRLAIFDMVAHTDIPEPSRRDMASYSGCVSGAATGVELQRILSQVGFEQIRIQAKDGGSGREQDTVFAAVLEATKPA